MEALALLNAIAFLKEFCKWFEQFSPQAQTLSLVASIGYAMMLILMCRELFKDRKENGPFKDRA